MYPQLQTQSGWMLMDGRGQKSKKTRYFSGLIVHRGHPWMPVDRRMVPLIRIERMTYCLQDSCSTN